MKLNALILLTLLVGCSNGAKKPAELNSADFGVTVENDRLEVEGMILSKSEVREFWLTELSEKNPQLYMEVVRAIIVSRKSKRVVYVLRDKSANGLTFYYPSIESEGGKDVVMVDFVNKELRFDHFSESDGPSLWDVTQKIWADKKVKEINKELKISDFN